ncbi:hypothetical protein QQ020_33140 [Fulvivirgaceae bacterium BMA12]|uniref:Uncharacterized protein n=1 Tax=Agaribacillus aureus TaxID=3051825 RepID=A0ABT8LGN3_9BACT|nr:hypothetical protein [Fulvivirgaceae bacterium BMA12]
MVQVPKTSGFGNKAHLSRNSKKLEGMPQFVLLSSVYTPLFAGCLPLPQRSVVRGAGFVGHSQGITSQPTHRATALFVMTMGG